MDEVWCTETYWEGVAITNTKPNKEGSTSLSSCWASFALLTFLDTGRCLHVSILAIVNSPARDRRGNHGHHDTSMYLVAITSIDLR